ncbi:hypothetical protein ADK60_37415 [Streptomyces sp. XY431]|nr:hypothetical protein ADK60_37415 [Streptomyces sp. XY431]
MADGSLKFLIDADHGQFYVQDLEPYDAWMAECFHRSEVPDKITCITGEQVGSLPAPVRSIVTRTERYRRGHDLQSP